MLLNQDSLVIAPVLHSFDNILITSVVGPVLSMESPVSDWSRLFDSLDFELPSTPAILDEIPEVYYNQPSTEYSWESPADNSTTGGNQFMGYIG